MELEFRPYQLTDADTLHLRALAAENASFAADMLSGRVKVRECIYDGRVVSVIRSIARALMRRGNAEMGSRVAQPELAFLGTRYDFSFTGHFRNFMNPRSLKW